ncbi:MAG: fatty acid desaturase [Solirubrobacterales bacterium]|nr:fatty acid desaturase [Solirubrobacterales bacterium]
MSTTIKPHSAGAINQIPRPEEPIPAVAWPTFALFAGALIVWLASTLAGVKDFWPAPVSVLVNGIAAFLMFSVAHECSHASASSNQRFNLWLGRVATPFFTAIGSFSLLRFVHMQHHRFTNHTDGSDPDHYTQSDSRFALPFRWMTIDFNYFVFYLSRISSRPRSEKFEFLVNLAIVVAVIATLWLNGYAVDVLLYYLIPTRIALFILAWSFDWLPHHELTDTVESNRFRATRNIVGAEFILTPLLVYQNYHLVHHLHPRIPFYRYIAVWRNNEDSYLANDPAMATPTGRPLTVEEYRRLREIEHSHWGEPK